MLTTELDKSAQHTAGSTCTAAAATATIDQSVQLYALDFVSGVAGELAEWRELRLGSHVCVCVLYIRRVSHREGFCGLCVDGKPMVEQVDQRDASLSSRQVLLARRCTISKDQRAYAQERQSLDELLLRSLKICVPRGVCQQGRARSANASEGCAAYTLCANLTDARAHLNNLNFDTSVAWYARSEKPKAGKATGPTAGPGGARTISASARLMDSSSSSSSISSHGCNSHFSQKHLRSLLMLVPRR